MGGLQIADEDCQTIVPGLYAAGDAASRELVTGASSGGGAVNSAWALSSGTWSGQAAARRARQIGSRVDRPVEAIGQAGLRPRRARQALSTSMSIERAQQEVLPYDKNLFRRGAVLARALRQLDQLWQETRDHLQDENVVRSRETAAVIASGRFAYYAALRRKESRGMHQREDATQSSSSYQARQTLYGLDDIRGSFDGIDANQALDQAV
jgi:succinate dehydrogenase/fumarate reductase flavoprotein subunit